jgi:hypothetical protein
MQDWRCSCGALLGRVLPTGEVEIRTKHSNKGHTHYRVRGRVAARCHRCQHETIRE